MLGEEFNLGNNRAAPLGDYLTKIGTEKEKERRGTG